MFLNDKGFTLIEVLVSMLILTIGLLGLLQAIALSMEHSMKSRMRNEGVIVADTVMVEEMAKGYENVSTSCRKWFISRQVMTALKNYSVVRNPASCCDGCAPPPTVNDTKVVTYEVAWRYKGVRYTHNGTSVSSKPQQ